MRIGVFGGTFDPPHLAHLVAAETARSQVNLDEVLFIPAGDPWQKQDHTVTEAAVRLRMVEGAIAGVTHFTADDREIRRSGPSKTVETLEELAGPTTELVLIVGADTAEAIPTWFEWRKVIEMCELAVVPRVGVDQPDLAHEVSARTTWLDMPYLDVSSTDIRSRVAGRMPYRFLVPAGVREVIESEGLYG
jgi:nicotinate-nucleotide adenylyltransferase